VCDACVRQTSPRTWELLKVDRERFSADAPPDAVDHRILSRRPNGHRATAPGRFSVTGKAPGEGERF
jgi:hypothetical protein